MPRIPKSKNQIARPATLLRLGPVDVPKEVAQGELSREASEATPGIINEGTSLVWAETESFAHGGW